MADAAVIQVAKAIAAEINAAPGGTFSLAVTAQRSRPDAALRLEDAETVQVDVVPVGRNNPQVVVASRGALLYRVACDVGVRKRFPEGDQDAATGLATDAAFDALLMVVEELGEYFAPAVGDPRRLTDVPEAILDREGGLSYPFSYIPYELKRNQMFAGIVRLSYQVPRTP